MVPARFPDGFERRAALELRAVDGRKLVGYVASFDVPAKIGSFVEVIRPGAFRKSLLRPGGDILALVDHDASKLLGNHTLRLNEDARGLAFSLDVPDTTLGRDVLELVQRGDIGGASFGFLPIAEAWPEANQRELREIDLREVSIIHAHPAYGAATEVLARSFGRAQEAVNEARRAATRRRRYLETL
jgi:uncharacterized protein